MTASGMSLSSRKPARPRGARVSWMSGLALFLTLAILYNDVLSGLVRYILAGAGLAGLFYLPFVAAIVFVIGYNAILLVRARAIGLLTIIIVLALIFLALLLGRPLSAVLFACYVWTPFFIGFAVATLGGEERLMRHAPFLWAIAVAGVLLNYFVPFPWVGTAYNVLGFEVQASIDWRAWEYQRLAGFSRASFAAANQIAILACFLLMSRSSWWRKLAVWTVSVVAVALTTTKTALILLVVGPAALAILDWMLKRWREGKMAPLRFAQASLAAIVAVIVTLPLLSGLQSGGDWSGRIGFLTLASIGDRLAKTWPQAFALIDHDRIAAEWVVGRGLGGIGIAQQFSEGLALNPGDNLFVYLYVSIGVVALLLAILIFRSLRRAFADERQSFRFVFLAAICVCTTGITTNVIESVLPCLLFGMVLSKGVRWREAGGRGFATTV